MVTEHTYTVVGFELQASERVIQLGRLFALDGGHNKVNTKLPIGLGMMNKPSDTV